jgi:hypothetical protein
MRGGEDMTNERLADEIRKQFASPSTRRYCQSLAVFRTDDTLPEGFEDLLAQLDAAVGRRGAR